eukprot:IDg11962t1
MTTSAVSVSGIAALLLCALAMVIKKRKKKARIVLKYKHDALMRPIFQVSLTPWKRILTYGSALIYRDCIYNETIARGALILQLSLSPLLACAALFPLSHFSVKSLISDESSSESLSSPRLAAA